MADESAGTGVAELDRALGGLYWGTTSSGCGRAATSPRRGSSTTPSHGAARSVGDLPSGSVIPLLDDAESGMRAYLVSMPRSATVDAPFTHKGTELVGVVSGLVQVLLASGRPVLRRGETLLASRCGITG